MEVYRISRHKYINDFSGTGAKMYGGRWNKEGSALLYTSSHLSLSVLEIMANTNRQQVYGNYSYAVLQVPDNLILSLDINDLPPFWQQTPYSKYTVEAGTNWANMNKSLALLVPSAVLKEEQTCLINPLHPQCTHIQVSTPKKLILDNRIIN